MRIVLPTLPGPRPAEMSAVIASGAAYLREDPSNPAQLTALFEVNIRGIRRI